MEFKEIETKYDARSIKLQAFVAACNALRPTRRLDTGSWDHYYLRPDGTALRYRAGQKPELTVKRKSSDRNNFVRLELNLKIDPETSLGFVDKWAEVEGYRPDFAIYKSCVIFYWDTHNVVYYVVYDTELRELDRYVEIEMSEDRSWNSEQDAWEALQEIEKQLSHLGINHSRRLRLSLQERYSRIAG
jgi:adenylate cyclase class IV